MGGDVRTIGPRELLGHIVPLIQNPSAALFDMSEGADRLTNIHTPAFQFVQINDPKLARQILTQHSGALAKGPFFARSRDLLGDGILTSDEPVHGSRRQRMLPYFSGARMDGYGTALRAIVDESVSAWLESGAISASQQLRELTLAAVLNCFFGTPASTESQAFLEVFVSELNSYTASRLLTDAALASSNRSEGRSWSILDKAAGSALRAILHAYSMRASFDTQIRDRMRGFPEQLVAAGVSALVDDRNGAPASGSDNLLTALCGLIGDPPSEGWSRSEVCDELLTVLLAGHETTANSLMWSLALVGSSGEIEASEARVIDQVILETLRLYPPAWVIPRIVTRAFRVDSFGFNAGTQLLISPYLYHRQQVFDQPDAFRPDRWTDDLMQKQPLAFMPFGVGDRACIGQRFAWLEMRTLLSSLLGRARVSLVGRLPEPEFLLTLRPSGEVPLRLSPI